MSENLPNPSSPLDDPNAPWIRWLLPVVLLVAFGVRLIGIGWGLPNELHNQTYHPDEQVIWSYAQAIEPTKLDFTPGFYNYGTLYLTVMRITTDVVSVYRGGPDPQNPDSVWAFVGACHLAGRYVSAIAGTIACALIFLMLRRVTHPIGAAIGGLLAALAPAWVVHSRFQTVDALAVCLLVASLYASVRLLDDPQPVKWALWAGAFAGLSTGTKYTGALVLLALAVALVVRSKQGDSAVAVPKVLGMGVLVWLGTFFVATPGVLLETGAFLRDFRYEMLHTATGHGLIFERAPSGFFYNLLNLLQGLHPIPVFAGIAGLVMAVLTKQRFAWVVLAFAVPYYVLIGRAEISFIRYTLPLIVLMPIFVGWLAGEMHQRGGRARIVTGLSFFCIWAAAMPTIDFSFAMSGTDPRDQLANYFKRESQPTTTVGLVSDPWYYTPALFKNTATMRGKQRLWQQWEEMAATTAPRPVQYIPPNPDERHDWDVRLIDEARPDYIVFSSFEVGPVSRLSDYPNDYVEVRRFLEFHARLEAEYAVVNVPEPPAGTNLKQRYQAANYLVHDLEYVRPLYWVWKRKSPESPTP